MMGNSVLRTILFCSTTLALGVVLGVWGTRIYFSPSCTTELQFVNKDIACGKRAIVDQTNYTGLREDIVDYIKDQKRRGITTDVGVYFRDLNNGPVLGINENLDFSPASLLKLPLAFVFFDLQEQGADILSQLVKYTNIPEVEVQMFPPKVSIERDKVYSIETLISNILTYSDNVSYLVLAGYLNGQPGGIDHLNQTFKSLGIVDPRSDTSDTVTVRGYASLFRLLYNAAYLNTDDSEKVLSLLATSDFDIGLVAGVPQHIKVAHKFGEREIGGLSPVDQLHDCGIIYYPENPYELCIMTRGTDIHKLPSVISTISAMVYKEVDSRKI